LKNSIHFDAEIRSIKSCVDKSFNITLNVPEYQKDQVKLMMDLMNDMVAVAMVSVDDGDKSKEYGGRLK
jgi:hypothetical protein